MRKLNEVYVTWTSGQVKVVPKSAGIPKGVDNFFDPALWDQSNPAQLLFDWFSTLTAGLYYIEPMNDAYQVWEALCDSIEEFNQFANACLHQMKYDMENYKGDKEFAIRSARRSVRKAVTVDQ